MIEIERKFLVTSKAYTSEAQNTTRIIQGFLNTDPERTVRVRLKGQQGFITVKGKSTEDGLSRFEWEKEISETDAQNLLKLCEDGVIDKMRYEIICGNHTFEVDEFFGDNSGLVVAEIELNYQTEIFKKPLWLGEEVTGQVKYYNAQLSKQPFNTW
ncbi:adenylate cyclase [Hanstruepera neustonica]|uniref:Adenylate cyclase n=1 Tax=Hanstruepera neustonica TaxID=1445657 RepID=A0A2K1E590_9FLAO|nr:CYTH domain-containing protein [Hanstruepera neustonica]PNQ75449.1 adenylate cyclase [Hanstruepera neustonica]